jgi:hypothetical protein
MSLLLVVHEQEAVASEAFVAQPVSSPASAIQGRVADHLLSVPLANAFALAAEGGAPQPAGANSAQILQIGANNAVAVLQSGGDVATIHQYGQNNTTTVVQFARAR